MRTRRPVLYVQGRQPENRALLTSQGHQLGLKYFMEEVIFLCRKTANCEQCLRINFLVARPHFLLAESQLTVQWRTKIPAARSRRLYLYKAIPMHKYHCILRDAPSARTVLYLRDRWYYSKKIKRDLKNFICEFEFVSICLMFQINVRWCKHEKQQ